MTAPGFAHVFVLCTGRCGSTTLARACTHIDNYTSAHESRTWLTGAARLDYPSRHIEIDNRLSWFLGRLDAQHGTAPLYVHLTRDPEAVAQSFLARLDRGIMAAYRSTILMGAPRRSADLPGIAFCRDYVSCVTENIRHFLRDKPHVAQITLEDFPAGFRSLWSRLGATGDLDAALATLAQTHNATTG